MIYSAKDKGIRKKNTNSFIFIFFIILICQKNLKKTHKSDRIKYVYVYFDIIKSF